MFCLIFYCDKSITCTTRIIISGGKNTYCVFTACEKMKFNKILNVRLPLGSALTAVFAGLGKKGHIYANDFARSILKIVDKRGTV